MSELGGSSRPVLQRRGSFSNALQAALDGVAVLAIAYLLIQRQIGVLNAHYTVMVMLLLAIMGLLYDRFAIYRSNSNFTGKAARLMQAWSLAFAVLLMLGFLTKQTDIFSRRLMAQLYVLGLFAQLFLHLVVRALQKAFVRHAVEVDNVIVVGTNQLASYLSQRISHNPWLSERVVGCVALAEEADAPSAPVEGLPPVLGRLDDLIALIEQHGARTVYFAIPLHASAVVEELYFKLLDQHVAIHWVPDIFSLRLINHSVREIAGVPVLTLSETPLTGTRRLVKALEDMVLGTLILVAATPVLVLVALAVRLDSPGPVFFRQSRMGWNGKEFRIWKFRSMVEHPVETDTVQQATKNDPRITRVGAFIRRTSLDELPQIFNVLRGEMSLVGPRPHAVQHDHEYAQRIQQYFARHNIKPGITGLAQVRGYRGETRDINEMVLRVQSDIEYINHWSLWLDLSILLRTFRAFTGKNAY
ncbi:MAG: undecaprenyl-phosphate glucose phosphotransferase [Comamonas sp. SCN 65-56]|uniref:undecaprenyl-phosphate glucose phosphotransferase n=1 Tax=Comamonas sp. SCN 65-56 TaxID=1660095 RepID=UPI0008686469|nr:undecaprenyl-phosphate glucose phosphotransferase [Comamonas sp. SCN 65-56]ODS91945.1 MAG: undecaprenyl-phosphate glucose phosphotransferase [Comamonas sp. SCN 65-56]